MTTRAQTAVRDVAQNIRATPQVARQVADLARDGFRAASQQGPALTAPVIPTRAQVTRAATDLYATVNRAADRLGGGLQHAGDLFERSGRALGDHGRDLVAIGRSARALGSGIANAPETAVAVASSAHREAEQLVHRAERAVEHVQREVQAGVETVQHGVEVARQGLHSLRAAVEGYAHEVSQATNVPRNIQALGDGDSYRLGVGGSVSVEGLRGTGSASIETTRSGNRYNVQANGDVAGGIYGQLGGNVSLGARAQASAEASGMLGLGGNVQFSFDNPADAARANDILLRQAAVAAASSQPGPAGMVTGAVARATLQPTADELRFLQDHMSAVELRGNVAAQVAGNIDALHLAQAGASGSAQHEVGVRIEFNRRGEDGQRLPPQLSVRETLTGQVAASAGLNVTNGQDGNAARGGALPGFGEQFSASVQSQTRYTLPPDVDLAALQRDPAGALRTVAGSLARSQETEITLALDGQGSSVGNGLGVRGEVHFTTSPAELARAGFAQHVFDGDVRGAMQSLGDHTRVSATVTPYDQVGIDVNPSVSLMGFGVGAQVTATRRDQPDPSHIPTWSGTGTQAFDEVSRRAREVMPPELPVRPVLIRG